MQGIFDDERRRAGGFAPSPAYSCTCGVRPKSPLTALEMLESGQHFLALSALSAAISDTNRIDVMTLNRP